MIKSPNWCMNTLDVRGPAEDLSRMAEAVKGHDEETGMVSALSFEAFLPTPPEKLEDNDTRTGWYNWRLGNWGTKWDVEADVTEDTPTHYTYHFDSAWAPPERGIQQLSELYPTLDFTLEFDEPGMDFWGISEFKAGEMVSTEEGPSQLNQQWDEENEDLPDDVEV